MITLTPRAVKAIGRFINGSETPVAGLRIAVSGGGCSGLQYDLRLEAVVAEDDLVVESDNIRLLMDPLSAPLLKGVTLDFFDSLTGSGFRFDNPNAKASCGCGASFSC